MASIYKRKDSPFLWIRYKDAAGKWKSTNTGYRRDNPGDWKQAKMVAKRKSLEEMESKPLTAASHRWEDWVVPWITARWGIRISGCRKGYEGSLLSKTDSKKLLEKDLHRRPQRPQRFDSG